MGRSHVAITAAAWAVGAPAIAEWAGRPLTPTELLASTVVAAGAAQLPDWDAPGSNLAHALGPLGRVLSSVVAVLAGGHRRGTHTLVAVALVAVASWAAQRAPAVVVAGRALPDGWPAIALVFLLAYTVAVTAGVAFRRARAPADLLYLLQAGTLTWVAYTLVPGPWWWLPWAVGVGYLCHLLEDLVTPAGLPWMLRPVSRAPVRLPLVLPTDGVLERALAALSGALAVAVVFRALLGW